MVGEAVLAASSLEMGGPELQSNATEGSRQQDAASDLKMASACPTCGIPLANGQPVIAGVEGLGRSGSSGGRPTKPGSGMSPGSRPLKAAPVLSPVRRARVNGVGFRVSRPCPCRCHRRVLGFSLWRATR